MQCWLYDTFLLVAKYLVVQSNEDELNTLVVCSSTYILMIFREHNMELDAIETRTPASIN